MKAQNNEFMARVKEAIDLVYLTTSDGPAKGRISKDNLTTLVVSELVRRGVLSRKGHNRDLTFEWAVQAKPTPVFYESVAKSLSEANKERNARYRSRKAARAKEQQEPKCVMKDVPGFGDIMIHPGSAQTVKEAPDEVLCEELFRRGWRIANGRLEKTIVMMLEDDGIRKVTV